jgi:hypothetical protein
MKIKLVGVDNSLNSPACFILIVNDNLDVIESDYIGFTTTKKGSTNNILHYRKRDFDHYCNQYIWNRDRIFERIQSYDSDDTYVAFEDYAFSANGQVFTLAEATGALKVKLLESGCKIRLYDPNSIKKFHTGYGNADKIRMCKDFKKIDDPFKPNLCFLKEYKSPQTDVVDAYFVVNLLLEELRIRKGFKTLLDLKNDKQREVFNKTSRFYPENILVRPFIKNEDI